MYRRKPQGWLKHIDLMAFDIVSLSISFLIAYRLKIKAWDFNSTTEYSLFLSFILCLDLMVATLGRTFDKLTSRGYYREFVSTVQHVGFVFIGTILFLFGIKQSSTFSRTVVFVTFMFYLLLSYILRCIVKKYRRYEKSAKRTIFIITNSTEASEVISNVLANQDNNNIRIIGLGIYNRDMLGKSIDDVPVLCSMDNIYEYLCRIWVDEVLIHMPLSDPKLPELRKKLVEMGITVHVDLNMDEHGLSEKRFVERVGKCSVITATINYTSTLDYIIKRFMDIIGGFFGSIAAILVCLVVGPIIKIKSPGPLLFSQERIGRNGKKFKMYKIRSMCVDAESKKDELRNENTIADGMMFKLDWDPRIIGNRVLKDGTHKTGIGQFIRSTSLDEFPQFFNVLKGDMSLVGTRPPTLDEWNRYDLHHRARLSVIPGITGLWQVEGRSTITDFEKVVDLDTKYILNWSLGLDARILLKTIKVVFSRKGAK